MVLSWGTTRNHMACGRCMGEGILQQQITLLAGLPEFKELTLQGPLPTVELLNEVMAAASLLQEKGVVVHMDGVVVAPSGRMECFIPEVTIWAQIETAD